MFLNEAHVADPKSRFVGFIDMVIVIGLLVAIAGSALAFGAVEPWSVASLGLLITALLVLWIIRGALNRRLQIFIPTTAMPIVALILLGVLQGVTVTEPGGKRFSVSLDSEATRLAIEVILVLFIAFLLSANFLTNPRRLTWLRNFLIYFGLGLSIFGMLQRFTWNGKLYWVINLTAAPTSLFGPFINHSHFAGYVEMIAPIPVALILRRAIRNELKLLYGFAAAMMGLGVMMSLSRGGIISFAAGMMFVVVFGFKPEVAESAGARRSSLSRWGALFLAPSRIGVIIVMIFTIGVGVWWVGADPVIRRIEKGELVMDAPSKDPGKETFFQSRGYIWRDTGAMIRDNWVTGIGLGAFQTVYPIYSAREGALIVSQSHNDYLQILADGGILGAIIALWFIFLLARDAVRASRHRNSIMAGTALGCSAGLFAIFVHSLFDFNLQIPSNALLFLVLCAVVSRIASAATSERSDQDVSKRGPWLEATA